jgi:hypothetical protein
VLYAAKCYWPDVTPTELARLASRAEQAGAAASPDIAYLGSLWFADDDVVLCLFEGPSRAGVRRASDQARIPWERLMAAAWVCPAGVIPFNPKATSPSARSSKQLGDQQCTDAH